MMNANPGRESAMSRLFGIVYNREIGDQGRTVATLEGAARYEHIREGQDLAPYVAVKPDVLDSLR